MLRSFPAPARRGSRDVEPSQAKREQRLAPTGQSPSGLVLEIEKHMRIQTMEVAYLEAGTMKIEIHVDRKAAGEAAALAAAQALKQLDHPGNGIGVIFATGASQNFHQSQRILPRARARSGSREDTGGMKQDDSHQSLCTHPDGNHELSPGQIGHRGQRV